MMTSSSVAMAMSDSEMPKRVSMLACLPEAVPAATQTLMAYLCLHKPSHPLSCHVTS